VFARKVDDGLVGLIKRIDTLITKNKGKKICGTVVMLGARDDYAAKLEEVAKKEALEKVPLTVADSGAAGPKPYNIAKDATFTIVVYDKSKTCCWDSTTTKMTDIVIAYAKDEQAKAAQKAMCVQPTVFAAKGTGDGFDTWRTYASQTGKSVDWKSWSEDEPCAQRAVAADTTARTAPYCAN